MEFKGTQGKWYMQEFTDVYTNIIRIKTENHDTIYVGSTPQDPKSESRYNALLMSKSLEMLEMLKDIKDYLGSDKRMEVEQLIKEATKLK